MNKQFFILLFFAFAAYGQQQEKVAIINTVDDGDSIKFSDLNYLTVRFRETAVNVLPKSRYAVMSMQSIVDFLGSEERAQKECKESSCLAALGRKVNADYVAQARIGRFDKNLSIGVELYNSKNGTLIGSFTGNSKSISGLLTIIDENAPILFKKMPGVSGGSKAFSLFVEGGISGLEKAAADYEMDDEKRYVVNLSTEPSGAVLSFDGVPSSSCVKTPCKAELREGSVRIIAALEQYETADTTVSVARNNQNIAIALKPNFGVLEIKPAYLDGIGEAQWSLTINGNAVSSWENRLSPNKYEVELNHRCYETLSFEVGINKGKHEVFDMASHIALKKGGLVLRAERDGEPAIEPVFVNGKRVGETPFSGSVPVCSEIEIGSSMETVDVEIKHKKTVSYTYQYESQTVQERKYTPQYESPKFPSKEQTAWQGVSCFGIGMLVMANSIDTLYESGGVQLFMAIEFFKPNISFFHWGLNLDGGMIFANKMRDALMQKYPEVSSDSTSPNTGFIKGGAFVKLYPSNFIYLLGGANFGYYGGMNGNNAAGDKIAEINGTRTAVFPVGVGLVFGSYLFDVQYNIALLKNGIGGYWAFNFGINPYSMGKR